MSLKFNNSNVQRITWGATRQTMEYNETLSQTTNSIRPTVGGDAMGDS
jgi:hypothetical protein